MKNTGELKLEPLHWRDRWPYTRLYYIRLRNLHVLNEKNSRTEEYEDTKWPRWPDSVYPCVDLLQTRFSTQTRPKTVKLLDTPSLLTNKKFQ